MKYHGIKTTNKANQFLQEHIPKFNQRFSVELEKRECAFRRVPEDLCIIQKRSYDYGGIFSFYNKYFKIVQAKGLPPLPPKARIKILVSPHSGLKASYQGAIYDTVPYLKPKVRKIAKPGQKKSWVPEDMHYYKYGHRLIRKVTFEESDREILLMLEDLFLSKIDR